MRVWGLLALLVGTPPALALEYNDAMFEARCGTGCHAPPPPEMLTAEQWPLVLDNMRVRMQQIGYPALEDAEYRAVLEYLRVRAR